MKTLDLKVHVGFDHHIEIDVPRDFPTGPARLHLKSEAEPTESIPPLIASGMLRDENWTVPEDSDVVAEILDEIRRERVRRLETSIDEISPPESGA